jgi:hypothetical protein
MMAAPTLHELDNRVLSTAHIVHAGTIAITGFFRSPPQEQARLFREYKKEIQKGDLGDESTEQLKEDLAIVSEYIKSEKGYRLQGDNEAQAARIGYAIGAMILGAVATMRVGPEMAGYGAAAGGAIGAMIGAAMGAGGSSGGSGT